MCVERVYESEEKGFLYISRADCVKCVCGGVKEAKDDDERRKGKQREMDGWMEGWTMFSRLWRARA